MEGADFLFISIYSIFPYFFGQWIRKAFIENVGFYAACQVGSNSVSRTINDTSLYGSTHTIPSPTALSVCVDW